MDREFNLVGQHGTQRGEVDLVVVAAGKKGECATVFTDAAKADAVNGDRGLDAQFAVACGQSGIRSIEFCGRRTRNACWRGCRVAFDHLVEPAFVVNEIKVVTSGATHDLRTGTAEAFVRIGK